ncbi:hypothetical protein M408DRAFT_330493 [Serendipita vermifera MAFF 305830]|uniref:Uncharacterized protein n=1 Tax=Serendipita vermifera MAFF 305830 TaxID=933852 RepID=A0A0C2XBI5_SERVB|nr:hypothetical protein M408DRAFT_330493 [Serendipita vermifera MAFF 305830]
MSSRTPVNGVGYDPTLLADAPQITKADKQEGYNPDLLEAQPNPRATPLPSGAARNPSKSKYAGASDESNGVRHAAVSPMGQPPAKKPRSRKLLFIILGAVLLILIAVGVGVGVGVTKSRGTSTAAPGADGGPGSTTTPKPIETSTSSTDTSKPIDPTSGTGANPADGNQGGLNPDPLPTTSGK